MLLKTILNHCQKFKRFVYGEARFVHRNGGHDIEPRKGSTTFKDSPTLLDRFAAKLSYKWLVDAMPRNGVWDLDCGGREVWLDLEMPSGVLQGVRRREAGATGFSVAEREVHREEYFKLKILTTNLPEL